MNTKRENRKKKILLCGGAGLEQSADLREDLKKLKMLSLLKSKGFAWEGGSVWICETRLNKEEADKVIKTAKKQNSLLVLKEEAAPDKVIVRRFLGEKILPQKTLTLACTGKMLTFLIDTETESIKILSDPDALDAVETACKEPGS